jgi:hypothetical protein
MTTRNGPDRDPDSQEPSVDERELRTYVTEVWCPPVDDGVVRMHSPMKEPQPEPQLEAGSMSGLRHWHGTGPAISQAEADPVYAETEASGYRPGVEARTVPEPELEA